MKFFVDKIKCSNIKCENEFFHEIKPIDVYDEKEKPYILCPDCLERIYLIEKEYNIKICFEQKGYIKTKSISKYYAILEYLREQIKKDIIPSEIHKLRDCFIIKE